MTILNMYSKLAIQLLSYVTENVYMAIFSDLLLGTGMRDLRKEETRTCMRYTWG
jgi:hypothetical protein